MSLSTASCAVCKNIPCKYRCPQCLLTTCCLACVKQHKEKKGAEDQPCTGVRDRAGFVPKDKYTDFHLLSDYRFLEDAERKIDSATRKDLVDLMNGLQKNNKNSHVNKWFNQARRCGVNLKLLPYNFTRRRNNKSYFHFKSRSIEWTVEWNFHEAGVKFTNKIMDNQTMQDAIDTYIHPTSSDPIIRHQLKTYVQSSRDDIKLFMKVEGRRADSVRYHEISMEKTLKDNLARKTVIEYPVIHVALKQNWQKFPPLEDHDSAAFPTSNVTNRQEVNCES